MKKTIISFLVAGALISAGTISAFAAGGNTDHASAPTKTLYSTTGTGVNYMDTDNDGVCDNYTVSGNATANVSSNSNDNGSGNGNANGSSNCNANGSGICNANGSGICNSNGSGYVDADHDGICDNYAGRSCPQDGTGNQYGRQHGKNR